MTWITQAFVDIDALYPISREPTATGTSERTIRILTGGIVMAMVASRTFINVYGEKQSH